MRSTAGQAIQRFFAMDAGRTEPPRPVFRTTTARRSETADLGESIATGVHAIYGPVRLYLCVSMEPKPEALAAQREADRKQAAGLFEVDALWSAAAVNARWARRAVLCGRDGAVLESAVRGAQGMTEAGAKEVFFEFNAMESYPKEMYLSDGRTRLRVR